MSRKYAPIYTSIWLNDDFRNLTPAAQRVYFLALSQPDMSYCGVVTFTTRRWAGMSKGTTQADIQAAVRELEASRFVTVDEETEELWVRSFVRHNQVWEQPQLRKAMVRDFGVVNSRGIRRAFVETATNEQVLSLVEAFGEAAVSPGEAQGAAAGIYDLDLDTEPVPGPPLAPTAVVARRTDPLFDAVVDVCGIVTADLTTSARGAANQALKQLRSVNATADEVYRRARNWPYDAMLTPAALAKHWPALDRQNPQARRQAEPKSHGVLKEMMQ